MIILGIESSCDDTGLALIEDGRKVLASCVSSQTSIHAQFGGIVPEIAAREHLTNIYPLYQECLSVSGIKASQIDAIAVTQGPGLIGALLVGISFAKGLASSRNLPLIPVDHVRAHIHGALLGLPPEVTTAELFPGLALVVSGGHTHLYLMSSPTSFTLLAHSVDDACGECFDKVAKIMGLPYPGGPVIEKLAQKGDPRRFPMPRMLANKKHLAFSYSGLKTHMATTLRGLESVDEQCKADLCAAFQEEAFGQIIRKITQACAPLSTPVVSLLVAGGVAANTRLREKLQAELGIKTYFPQLKYCADNGAMIAAYGWHRYQEEKNKAVFADPFRDQSWDAYSSYIYTSGHT